MQNTFVMIKPDHYDIADRILEGLDLWPTLERTTTAKVEAVPRQVIEAHYSPHEGKPFFPHLVNMFTGRPAALAVYEGEGVIARVRELAGPTDPAKAPSSTIRGKHSKDSLEQAIREGRACQNVIHCSDSPEEAEREIQVWSEFLYGKK